MTDRIGEVSRRLEREITRTADPVAQLVVLAEAVSDAARAVGIRDLTVTGGAAVAILTGEDFGTRDVDVVTAQGRDLGSALERLGFRPADDYRDLWVSDRLGFVIESPASELPPGSATVTVRDHLRLWSPTDLVVDRLAQACCHGDWGRFRQALVLRRTAGETFERDRALRRAEADGLRGQFLLFEDLYRDILAARVPPEEAVRTFRARLERCR